MAVRLHTADRGFEAAFAKLLETRAETQDVDQDVGLIIDQVRARGDGALAEFTARFDGHEPRNFRVGEAEIAAAEKACVADALVALKAAAARIETFHRRQVPVDERFTDDTGVELGSRWTPIAAVGIYVPGGKAAYPSSVLMNALPARVAGVGRVVMCVPAPKGELNPLVLAAARLAGVHEIYRVGGAQAVAALAYGTETILPVDKIVGPGNAYVAAAKRQVSGRVGIDAIAGPSEVLVLADGDNDPAWIAADLLAQAEHDELAQAILMTDDEGLADDVLAALEAHLAVLPRAPIAAASWRDHGAVVILQNLGQAVALIDRVAPEHLELAVADPEGLAAQVRNAGAIFLGPMTPGAVGDYMAGPNHVLPTSGAARYASGLSVLDFLKRTSIVRCGAEALAAIGGQAAVLAAAEGLEAHALSINIRLDRRRGG